MTGKVQITKEICDKSKNLFARTCDRTNNEEIKKCLELAIKTVNRIENLLPDNKCYMIAFAGLTNVGKSTFLNALLDGMVAPVKNAPWSSTPVEYKYGDRIKATLSYNDTFSKRREEFNCANELLVFLESCATQGSTGQASAKLLIELQSEVLETGGIVVDTPGFGATDGTGDTGLHDEILLKYINDTKDLQRIFWIVKGDSMDNTAVEFFQQHLSEKCTDLIVNITSKMEEIDKKRYEARYRPAIGDFLNIHYINAKKALNGVRERNDAKLAESGILQIRDIIKELSSQEGRAEIVKNDLLSLFRDLCEHFASLNSPIPLWPPTAVGILMERVEMTRDLNFISKFNQYFKLKV